jgi:hypothetical protein
MKFCLKISDFDLLSFETFALEKFTQIAYSVRFAGYYQ